MKINKKLLPFLIPVITGLIIGSVVLIIHPSTGKKLGDIIYSSGVSVESYSYAVGRAAPSVMNIYVAHLNDDYTKPDTDNIITSASGVVYYKNGIIVTNYHVVTAGNEPDNGIWAQTRDGKIFKAFVVGTDRRTDLAVLKVETSDLPPINKVKKDPKVGDIVLAIGNPNNLGQTVTHGIVSALSRSGSGLLTKDQMNIRQGVQELIQTDAPINQGNSGGALINSQGLLIGINTASFNSESTYGIGFAVPTSMVTKVVDEILAHGKVERGYLGISDAEVSSLAQTTCVTVGFIDPQGPAFGILKIGDIIKKVDDVEIADVRQLIDLISQSKPGRTLTFEILRNNDPRTESITLTEDNTSIE